MNPIRTANAGTRYSSAEATGKLPDNAVRHQATGFASSLAALRGSFGFYRAWDATTEQNRNRKATKLTMPVLAVGGKTSSGDATRALMPTVADDVRGLVLPGAGHFVAEEAKQMIAALAQFLAPCRDGGPTREDAGAFASAGDHRAARAD